MISHASAAVLHGLPTWSSAIDRMHVTRDRSGGGRRRPVVHVHGAPLRAHDVVVVDGIAVTSVVRTVLDLARTVPMEQAVAAGDRALALGLSPLELERGLVTMEHWPGVRRARRVVGFLDGRSESAGESVSRVRMFEDGLPIPDLQHEIFGPDGRLVARVDFLWEEQQTSVSSTARSSTVGSCHRVSRSRRSSTRRRCARMRCETWAGRSSGGSGGTSIGTVWYAAGSSEPSPALAETSLRASSGRFALGAPSAK